MAPEIQETKTGFDVTVTVSKGLLPEIPTAKDILLQAHLDIVTQMGVESTAENADVESAKILATKDLVVEVKPDSGP